jgi:hypothetical protein
MPEQAVLIPMTLAGLELLVEVVPRPTAGTQNTSAQRRISDAYERLDAAIRGIVESVAGTVNAIKQSATTPDKVEVELGLGISVEGDIIVMKGATQANVCVRITYDIPR